jgi:hypothetical protein
LSLVIAGLGAGFNPKAVTAVLSVPLEIFMFTEFAPGVFLLAVSSIAP